MRRSALALALAALCALAGCGGGDNKSSSPLDDALGYFSKDAPFVAAIQTDPTSPQIKQVTSLAGAATAAPLLAVRLENLVSVRFVDWARDIRPQLGAPLVIGLAKPAAGRKALGIATVVAMRINNPLKIKQVLLRQPDFRGRGKSSGVRIYENALEHRYAAVDGHVLVAATDRDILEHALALRRTDNRMRASDFNADLKGLPADGLVRISADPRQMIGADPRLRPALGVKWLASLRRMGAVLKAGSSGVTLDLRAASDPSTLSDSDLPLAPKAVALPLIGGASELQLAVSDPARLVRLAAEVLHRVAPRALAGFRAQEPRGIDLEQQLPHHLDGLAVAAIDPGTHRFALRATLRGAAEVQSALARLAPAFPALADAIGIKGVGFAAPAAGEKFYALAKPNGKTVIFGVVGNTIVVASDAKRAGDLASEPNHSVPGLKGAAELDVNARTLAANFLAQRLHGFAALLVPIATASLRDLTGALTISRTGLDGHFKLALAR